MNFYAKISKANALLSKNGHYVENKTLKVVMRYSNGICIIHTCLVKLIQLRDYSSYKEKLADLSFS